MGTITSPKSDWKADAGRRRSMRVLLSVPILVSGKTADNQDFKEETRTLVVNAHGALIALEAQVAAQQSITLSNKATRESIDCRVVHLGSAQGGKTQVGVEFVKPSGKFCRSIFLRMIGSFRKTNSPSSAGFNSPKCRSSS